VAGGRFGRVSNPSGIDVRLVVDGVDVAHVEVASTPAARRIGLLQRDSILGAMWFPGVSSVHTVRMRFTIDVAHVGKDGVVLSVQTMKPNRVGRWRPRAAGILEAQGGAFVAWKLFAGSSVKVGAWSAN
jgi:uncharacterized protein